MSIFSVIGDILFIRFAKYCFGALTKFVAFYQNLKFHINTQTFVYFGYRIVSATETTDITLFFGLFLDF